MTRRRPPLLLVVVVALVATGVASGLTRTSNPAAVPGGLTVSMNAASTALYCTGLSAGPGAPGRVVFYNTAATSRSLDVTVNSDTAKSWNETIELAGHANETVEPSLVDAGHAFGVGAQISGGGVVAEEIAGTNRADVPCRAKGVTDWWASGFDTSVGSSATLSLYNPTATAAVADVAIYGASGVSDPVAFQGLSVPAHAESVVELGKEVVDTSNVGVAVHVVRGSLTIVGVQNSAGVTSLVPGVTGPTTRAWYPAVTTVKGATARLFITNPTAQVATVTVGVTLSTYHVANQVATIQPYSTGEVDVTPNQAIPAAGYASLAVSANVGVVSSLATGTASWFALSSPVAPANALLVRDFNRLGFDGSNITNSSSHAITVTITTLVDNTVKGTPASTHLSLASGATLDLASSVAALSTRADASFLLSTSSSSMVVGLTLPSTPRGVDVVVPLDGR